MTCNHDWEIDPVNENGTSRSCKKCFKVEIWQWLEKKKCYGWPEQ